MSLIAAMQRNEESHVQHGSVVLHASGRVCFRMMMMMVTMMMMVMMMMTMVMAMVTTMAS